MKLNPDQISLIINRMNESFSDKYLTKEYFGENPYKDEETKRIFLNGYCALYALALKEVIPQAEYYFFKTQEGGKHIVLQVDGNFYDARGFINLNFLKDGKLEKIQDVFEVPSVIPEDYLFGHNEMFYDGMIKTLAKAGKDYQNLRGW